MHQSQRHFITTFTLGALLAVVAGSSAETPLSTTLAVMEQRIENATGKWSTPYQLYLLWPRSENGASKAYLPRPDAWPWAYKGSLEDKIKLTSNAKFSGKISMGFIEITRTKSDPIKGDQATTRHFVVIEHDPAFAAGDPLVDEWMQQIKDEYDDQRQLYALWPRWLPTPVGWRDAFQIGNSLYMMDSYDDLAKMENKAEIVFKERSGEKHKRRYRIVEHDADASSD